MDEEYINNIFTYHPPKGNQAERYTEIRQASKAFALLLVKKTPGSREQSVAIRKLREAVMWANAAIAINENEV